MYLGNDAFKVYVGTLISTPTYVDVGVTIHLNKIRCNGFSTVYCMKVGIKYFINN